MAMVTTTTTKTTTHLRTQLHSVSVESVHVTQAALQRRLNDK